MHKRIAVLDMPEQQLAALRNHDEVVLCPLDAKGTPPSGTVGLVADPAKALDAALAVGAEQEQLLKLIADAVAVREGIPLGDAERVRDHAARFAQALGLDADAQLTLERAALLRDVGKLRIPNEILLNKSVLDYDQWRLLKSHSKLGAELLLDRNVCTDVTEVVRYHHECYDGDGYPEHLEGEDIPYAARIMKILDVYCAMTSPRLYRSTTSSREEALEHLAEERGKHFDPHLIDVFLDARIGKPRS